jgi:hypothetical protein
MGVCEGGWGGHEAPRSGGRGRGPGRPLVMARSGAALDGCLRNNVGADFGQKISHAGCVLRWAIRIG